MKRYLLPLLVLATALGTVYVLSRHRGVYPAVVVTAKGERDDDGLPQDYIDDLYPVMLAQWVAEARRAAVH